MDTYTDQPASVGPEQTPPDTSQGYPVAGTPETADDQQQQNVPSESPESHEDAPQGDEMENKAQGPDLTPEEREKATERLKQMNARNARLLSSLGIDPLSDVAEQLEQGVITEDMLIQHIAARHGLTPAQAKAAQGQTQPEVDTNDPVALAQREYEEAKEACYREGKEENYVSFETNARYNEAYLNLQEAKANAHAAQLNAQRQQEQYNENVEQVLTVARSNDYYQGMPDDVKQASDFVHVAVTGAIADQEARSMGLDPQSLNAQQYQYFARRASEQLSSLVGYFRQSGMPQGMAPAGTGNSQKPIPTPIGSGGSPASIPNPYANVSVQNHKDAARQFAQGPR